MSKWYIRSMLELGGAFLMEPAGELSDYALINKGRYAFINPQFRRLFVPCLGDVKGRSLQIALSHLQNIEDVVASVRSSQGLDPAGTRDLLCFGAQYPDVQNTRWPIVSLFDLSANRFQADREFGLVPALSWGDTGRRLGVIFPREWADRGYWVLTASRQLKSD